MRTAFLWLLAALVLIPDIASAQSWPSRPVRMIVPQAAGGTPDIVARVISSRLSRELGQQVLVENRAGDGTIGAQAAARAQADGYTYLFAPASTWRRSFPTARRTISRASRWWASPRSRSSRARS
jgi:tripartite-type tricarboxylate transporter receptor subunit TctC